MQRTEHVVADASTLPSWRKSSYSGHSGGECLEVCEAFAPWRKSTHSENLYDTCLEVGAATTPYVPVRDSKDPHGPAVLFGGDTWSSFVRAVQRGELT